MAHRHHCYTVARAPQRGAPRAGAGRSAAPRAGATTIADRPLSVVHPADPGAVPDADGQPSVRHGPRARLSWQSRSLPPARGPATAASPGGGLSAPAQPAGGAGAGGLGAFWPSADWPRPTSTDGLRDGTEPLAAGLP